MRGVIFKAFIGVAAGIVLGLLWGEGQYEGGVTFPMAIPCAVLGGLVGAALTLLKTRRGATWLGGGGGALAGAAWGGLAEGGNLGAALIMAGVLGAAGAGVGRWLGTDAADAAPPVWTRLPYGRTALGGALGVLLGLAWGSAAYEGGGEVSLAWITGAVGLALGLALDRADAPRRVRLWAAVKYAAAGFFIGGYLTGGGSGGAAGALAGFAVGLALGWTQGPAIAAAAAWRPAAGEGEARTPPAWARALAEWAGRLRLPLAAGLALGALAMAAASVDGAIADVKSANLIGANVGAACALAYAAWAVANGALRDLGHATAVPAHAGGPGAARALTFARRWRVGLVLTLVWLGSALVADSFQASYVYFTTSQTSRSYTEHRGGNRYRVTETTTHYHRRERGGDTLWLPLIVGGLALNGARRLNRGVRRGQKERA